VSAVTAAANLVVDWKEGDNRVRDAGCRGWHQCREDFGGVSVV